MASSKTAVFTASGNWTAPLGVSAVWLTEVGGGGGATAAGNGLGDMGANGGAGAGEIVVNRLISVVPETEYSVIVGAGGIGGVTQGAQPTSASNSSFNGFSALKAGAYATPLGGSNSGAGGGVGGSVGFISGAGFVAKGRRESTNWTGGGGGGGGSGYPNPAGVNGGVIPTGGGGSTAGGSGGAGAGAIWGGTTGAPSGMPANAPASATDYGAGAGGTWSDGNGAATPGGNGAPGYVMLMWVA